jgi:hypothetical protein
MPQLAATIFADGPASAPYEPFKPDIRDWGTWIEGIIAAFLGNGGLIYPSRALLYADLAHPANSSAWVLGDATVAFNGVYRKIGGSGSGSWTRVADLPYSFIIANDAGAGTPNAIIATTSLPVGESQLVWLNIATTNTASPVTVSFNGAGALTIKTNSGNDPAAGGLVAGTIVMGIKSGSTFRLLSDQASAAVLAAAEAAKIAAQAAQAAAEAAAASVNIKNVATRTALKALVTAVSTLAFLGEAGRTGTFAWRTGDYSAQITADTAEGIYIKANAIAASAGAWVRQGGWKVSGVNPNWCGVVGDGTTIDTVAFQAALTLAGYVGSGTVPWAGQTALIDATLSVPAAVSLVGDLTGVIKQKNAGNLGEIMTFGNNAGSRGIIYDGNRANNTDNSNYVNVRIGNSNDVIFEGNIVRNSTGSAIAVNNGLRAKITKNTISNFHDFGVAAFGNNGFHAHDISDNWMVSVGWAGIILQQSDYCKVSGNQISGQIVGGRDGRLNVNSSGTTLTWVSGPTFAGILAGNFVVLNNGVEVRIASVNSPTSITTETTLPTLSNTPATLGSGDLIGCIASSFCNITKNLLNRTATFLFGFSLGATVVPCGNNVFSENILNYAGKNAINVAGVGSGAVDTNSIIGNKIFNAGYGAGIGTVDGIAIFFAGVSAGKIENTLVADNTIISATGAGQTTYWLGTDLNMSFGSIRLKGNSPQGMATKGIYNDVVSIVLSAEWGSTAAVSAIVSHGDSLSFNITCGGTGYNASPNFTINKICDTPNDPPQPMAKITSNSGGALLSIMYGEQLSARGIWKAYMGATPASGHFYAFIMKA